MKIENISGKRQLYRKCKAFYTLFSGRKDVYFIRLMLSFRDIKDFDTMKIARYFNVLRKFCDRRGIKIHGYLWVLEKQKRGVPHYHAVIVVNRGVKIPKPDKSWWNYGASSIKASDYFSYKYLTKESQAIVTRTIKKFVHRCGVGCLGDAKEWFDYLSLCRALKIMSRKFGELCRKVKGKWTFVENNVRVKWFGDLNDLKTDKWKFLYGLVDAKTGEVVYYPS
ncbi:MAG TPA: hypothetical protein PLH46_00765 [Caldisericia bacterium]|nr:hypothetical protein [Caldisericia bacterium]